MGSCCGKKEEAIKEGLKKIAIVGNPNVGKSVMFNCLTGSYVNVSNYPGTTVEVSRGRTNIGQDEFEVIDTPGMYSMFPITEEERVARRILIEERPDIVLYIVDSKNLARMLPLGLQLIESGLPLILVLNIIDEAEKIGMRIDIQHLERELKVPVVATVSTTGRGVDILRGRIEEHASRKK
jgi:ferrous iron transport protein B